MDKEELLNAYFQGTLSGKDQEKFEALLASDPSFREDYELQMELRQALRHQEHQELRTFLSEQSLQKKTFEIRRYIPAMLAAAILLLVTIGYLLFNASVDSDPEALYLAYFEPYENVVHPIERGDSREDQLSRAFAAYENGSYEEAIRLFEKLQQPDPYIDFYSGIVLLQLNRDDEATDHFLSYLNSEGKLQDRAQWYLALAYLKQEKTEKALDILREILEKDGYKSEEASQIIDQLN